MTPTDLARLARRYDYDMRGNGFSVELVRITTPEQLPPNPLIRTRFVTLVADETTPKKWSAQNAL